MIVLGRWEGKEFSLSVKNNSLTVSFNHEQGSDVFSWERSGRLWTGMENGISYRRGLNGRVVAKWQTFETESVPHGMRVLKSLLGRKREPFNHQVVRGRRWLDSEEGLALEERAGKHLANLFEAIEASKATTQEPLPEGTLDFVKTILDFDRARSMADRALYAQVYKPVGILPPDQYFSVVLQATEGCSFNSCTYCSFYRDRPFRIKNADEFREHARAVKAFIGEGISLRRTIFFGDANALAAPIKRLNQLFDVANQEYDVEALGGIFAFLDGFSGERKQVADYQELASKGLSRVYLGLESGNPDLLRFLKKPGSPGDVLHAVSALKEAGVAVGIIVLLGAGGQHYARRHVADTVKLLNAMPLDADDLIYFSELIENEGMDYTRDAHLANLRPLTSAERISQGDAIEVKLRFSVDGGTPHISRYDIREFVY